MADAYDFWALRLRRDEAVLVDAFWDRFAEIAQPLDRYLLGRPERIDPKKEMRLALGPLAEQLFWEFGATDHDGQMLYLTAELFHRRRVLARAVSQRAPDIPGWRVADTRLPVVSLPEAVETILNRSRANKIFAEELTPTRGAHRQVDLEVVGVGEQDFLADQAGVIFAVLLGDVADQNWLGECRAVSRGGLSRLLKRASRGRKETLAWLESVRGAAVDMISGIEAERPDFAFRDSRLESEKLYDFRLNPVDGDRTKRRDAIAYVTRYRQLVAARFAGVPVSSLRFSRFFEAFCGLKITRDPQGGLNDSEGLIAFTREVESALMSTGLGGVTGRAEGLEHFYVDVALEDLEQAVEVLKATLSRQKITAPVWLLFDEAGLEDRYFPLTPLTPPRPLNPDDG